MTADAAAALRLANRPAPATVLVVSTRAAAGVYADETGPIIRDWLRERGFAVADPVVVADASVADALASALAGAPDLLLTTGGTGLSPDDRTPEATAALLDREIPGLMEELRRRGLAATPMALLTRGVAGVAGPHGRDEPARIPRRRARRPRGAGSDPRPPARPGERTPRPLTHP